MSREANLRIHELFRPLVSKRIIATLAIAMMLTLSSCAPQSLPMFNADVLVDCVLKITEGAHIRTSPKVLGLRTTDEESNLLMTVQPKQIIEVTHPLLVVGEDTSGRGGGAPWSGFWLEERVDEFYFALTDETVSVREEMGNCGPTGARLVTNLRNERGFLEGLFKDNKVIVGRAKMFTKK